MHNPLVPGSTGNYPQDELRSWLIERIAVYLDLTAVDIDPARPLAEFGLDSVYALSVCGDIEDELSLAIEPTLAWDYPTIDAIAGHLHTLVANR